ncbi:hypothetical protein [Miniphocaeibacter massiliensis]|uniref:hypothetical protein n=1 Tax=Miniphocaeibacter massiliensis TaxID=2041841 RepID=UPI000C1C00C0|nr:hypothetical protein [Miniphocaeibacter massiliensis]
MKALMISLKYNEEEMDIIVKENQRINDVIKVLKDNNMLIFFREETQVLIKSWRLETIINPYYTFKQANIENGDSLEIFIQ